MDDVRPHVSRYARTAQTLLNVAAAGTLHPPLNVVISNVPGSPVPLYFCGARLEANYPLSVITDGMGLNLTILSYEDRIDFGIVGDREEVPDVWFLAEEVQHAFQELLDLVPRKAAPKKKAARKPKATGAA